MIDAKRLLDQFLGAGQQEPSNRHQSHGARPGDAGQRGVEANEGIIGGIGRVLGTANDYARDNPLLSGGLAGGLASILLGSKGGRRLATQALTYGGAAAIGALAYKAYRDYQAGQGQSDKMARSDAGNETVPLLPPPPDSPFAIANAPQGENAFALELISAMITASKADGHIDDQERAKILSRCSEAGLDNEATSFIEQELAGPLNVDRIVKAARTKEEAVELYAASLLAIAPDHAAERAYLDLLAARLGLEPELAKTIERTVRDAQS
jgi:uncharacterized membrane protein YebE (DUF533 family)